MSKCKYCGGTIRWVKTISGKSMPCDDKKYALYIGAKQAREDKKRGTK